MKATVVESLMGIFGFGEKNELVEKVLFPKDAEEIAERLEMIENGKIIEELATLVNKMKEKGYRTFLFERMEIARIVHKELGVDVDVKKPSEAGEYIRENLGKFAVEVGFVKDETQINGWVHNVSMELTKIKVRKATEKRDLLVVQTIQAIDDVDKTLNLFMNRTREWYGLHFPELNLLIEKHETYARLVNKLGRKDNFTIENLMKEGIPKSKAEKISEVAQKSMGAELFSADLEQIRRMCEYILRLYDVKASLEKYIDMLMEDVAPNIKALTGATLGARLIALAGGLGNLAKMPSSTIQVLGAEKALFRSLRSGARPPKHGIIFQHNLIHGAKRWWRGRIARALAGKLAIASRTDAYSGKYIGGELRADLEKRVEEIKERVPKPKPRPPERQRKRVSKKKKRAKRRGRKG